MKKFKISKIDVIKHDKAVEPHVMINPETGEQVEVTMQSEHEELTEQGFVMGDQVQQQQAPQQPTYNIGGTHNADSTIGINKKKKKHKDGGVSKYDNLTGQFIEELPTRLLHKADSEVEDDEFLKFPNGEIREAKGDTHENGGIDLNLPDNTQILSDHLKVGKTLAKDLKKEHGINVKASDTYAQALTKYNKKLGLEELNNTQAELFEMLEKEEKTSDDKTKKVNASYINSKIVDIENKKKALGEDKSAMFDKLFDKQEATKPKKKEEFRYGGVSEAKIRAIAEKNGLSMDKAMFLLGGKKGHYQDGDEVIGDEEETIRAIIEHENTQTGNVAGHQSKEGQFFGRSDEEIKTRIKQGANLYPELYNKYFAAGDFSKDNVLGFQQDYNKQADANLAFAEKSMAAPEFEKFKNRIEESKFVDDPSSFRYTDSKLGRFTSSRPGFESKVFNEEKTKALKEQGITHLSQLLSNPEKAKAAGLTEEDIARASSIKTDNPDINFALAPIKEQAAEPVAEPVVEEEIVQPDPTEDIVSTGFIPEAKQAKGFVFPDQSLLPPGALEPHLLLKSRRQRIDPVKMGVEDQLTEINRQAENVESQLATLPANQRAAALASILATTQQSGAKAITDVNRLNVQQQQSADLFNIQQADTEKQLQGANLLSFEQRQLTAKAKTDKDLRDYLEFNRNVALNNLRNQQTLNMLDVTSPDFELDMFGNAVNFDPSYNYQLGKGNNSLT